MLCNKTKVQSELACLIAGFERGLGMRLRIVLVVLLDGHTPLGILQLLYPTVTVGRVASPLVSVADGTASWCHSSGLCWVVLLDGHTWQMVKCPAGVRYFVSWWEG